MIKSIDTFYNGNFHRSRLEARWAHFFKLLSIPYEYEQEGFEDDKGNKYLPDFYLPQTYRREEKGVYVEIKHKDYKEHFTPGDWFQKGLILFRGTPDENIWGSLEGGDEYYGHPDLSDYGMMFWICSDCGTTKIDHYDENYNYCPKCKIWKCSTDSLKWAAEEAALKRFEHGQ